MDISTLFFVEGTLLFLFGATMLADSAGQDGQTGKYWFAASNFCGAFGLIPRPWLGRAFPLASVPLSNALLFLELCLLTRAIAEFVDRGRRCWLALLGLSTAMTMVEIWVVLHHYSNVPIVYTISAVTVCAAACSAFLLLRYTEESIRPSAYASALLFSFYGLSNIERSLNVHSHTGMHFYHIWLDRTILASLSVGYLLITNAQLRHRVMQQATIDPLTGVLNRRAFDGEAARLLEQNRRAGRPVAALMLDLDHFKEINDRLGHHAGDQALREFAGCLRQTMRTSDLIVRLGGDEFIVILPEADMQSASGAADRLREHLEMLRIQAEAGEFRIQSSIGVVSLSGDDLNIERLLQLSDQKLYAAKAERRGSGSLTPSQAAM